MRRNWFKYSFMSAMVFCALYADGVAQNIFAQDTVQNKKASEGGGDDLKKQLNQMEEAFLVQQKMMKQMETLALRQQEQIKELKNRVEAQSGKSAIIVKEEIREEVKQELQQDVKQEVGNYLASDDARKKLGLGLPGKYEPVNGYYMPDKEKASIGFQTSDGKYSLYVGFRFQSRFTYKDRDDDFDESDITDLDVRRARLCFGGNIYRKDINYYVELDADSFTYNMRDYYVYWTPIPELNVKTGYFKVPANRQWDSSGFKLLLQDRSIACDNFKQDRDYSLDIYGLPFEGHAEYHIAVFRGAGKSPAGDVNTDNELMYVMSARYNPFGIYDYYDETDLKYTETFKATMGASIVYGGKEKDAKVPDSNIIVGSVDFGVRYKGFTWDSEGYMKSKDSEPITGGDTIHSDGFYTQAGYFILPKKVEIATRYSVLDPNNDMPNDIQREYTGGINYYLNGHRSKIQADMGHFVTDTTGFDKNENRIRLQYQMIF
ncbi:MAG: porin [Candidatus Brocadiaceae bacterium]